MSYLFFYKSVSKRKVCIIFIKNLKILKNPKKITFLVGFLVGFLGGFFGWVFYCQPWGQVGRDRQPPIRATIPAPPFKLSASWTHSSPIRYEAE